MKIIELFHVYHLHLFSTILTFYLDFSEDLFLINFRIFITLISILMIFKLSIDSLLINVSMLVKEIIFKKIKRLKLFVVIINDVKLKISF